MFLASTYQLTRVVRLEDRVELLETEIEDLKALIRRYEERSRVQRDLFQEFAKEIESAHRRIEQLQERLNG